MLYLRELDADTPNSLNILNLQRRSSMPTHYYAPKNWRAKDISSQKFGLLTVLRCAETRRGTLHWFCLCECGNTTIVSGKLLRNGHTRSCGCLIVVATIQRNTKHGKSKSLEYVAWRNMLSRCYDIKKREYKHYGGRGITVCDSWKYSFDIFFVDMGIKPDTKHTLERRNNNAGYTPDNCYWGTRKEQARNTRTNRLITYNDTTQCLSAWEEQLGFPANIIRKRLQRGWAIEKALTTPSDQAQRQVRTL